MPVQNTEIFFVCKNRKFHWKNFDILYICAPNIDFVHTLEPLHGGGSNEYQQPMFWNNNKKNRFIFVHPSFTTHFMDMLP